MTILANAIKGSVKRPIRQTQFEGLTVQTNNKWYAFQLNSKFDKTQNLIQVLSQLNIERGSLFIYMTYYFLISHFISLIERHVFSVKACLLFVKKFVIN